MEETRSARSVKDMVETVHNNRRQLFIDTVKANAPLYNRTQKVPALQNEAEYQNYVRVSTTVDVITLQNQFNDAVGQFGLEASTILDALVRTELTSHGFWINFEHYAAMVTATDIFANGNLNVHAVLQGASLRDPMGNLSGWVAYRFHFATRLIK